MPWSVYFHDVRSDSFHTCLESVMIPLFTGCGGDNRYYTCLDTFSSVDFYFPTKGASFEACLVLRGVFLNQSQCLFKAKSLFKREFGDSGLNALIPVL